MKKLVSMTVCVLILLSCTTAYACTIFSASDRETVLAGNNEDWHDKDTYMWILPAEEGKFGRIFFGFEYAWPEGGMNEHGLFFDWTADYEYRIDIAEPGKLDYDGSLCEYIIETCRTVEEAIAVYDIYNENAFGFATIFLADSSGDSATVTCNRNTKQIEVTRKTGFYLVHGYGERAVEKKLEASGGALSVELFRDALEAAQQGDITLYSNICDLKTGDIYLYNQHNFDECVQINIHEELKKGPHMYYIPSLFPGQKAGTYDKIRVEDTIADSDELIIFTFGAIFLLSLAVTVFVYIPITLLKKSGLKRGFFKPRLSIFAHATGAVNAASSLWLIGTLWFHGPFIVRYGMSIYSQIGAYVPILLIALTLCQIVFTIIVWCRKYWPVISRIHYTLLTASMLFVIFILYQTNIMLP